MTEEKDQNKKLDDNNDDNKKKSKVRVKFRHKHKYIYYGFWSCLILGLFIITFMLIYVTKVLNDTPKIDEDMLKSNETSKMYDKNGNLIWADTKTRRDYIKYKDIPKPYKEILFSVEDQDFYKNDGFSYKGIINAGFGYVKEKLGGPPARGGSTLEQQLIKNVVFSYEQKDRNVDRKIKELMLSIQLDKNFSKNQILEWYINKIAMGENSYGAKTAMMTYYGKDLKDMNDYSPDNLSKIATIVGLAQAPSSYNIYDNPDAAQERKNNVLYAAKEQNNITKEQYDEAIKVNVKKDLKDRYWRNRDVLKTTKDHAAYVNSTLKEIKDLGYDIQKTPLQIHTKLDPKNDKWLNDKVNESKYFQDKNHQVAVTVLDNKTGDVISQVGGRFVNEPYGINRATQRTRSSGSIIKPFIDYGPAIEYLGYGTDYKLNANNYTYPGTNIVAHNYGRWEYGNVDMKEALWQSYNTPALRLLDRHIGSNRAKKFLSGLNMDIKDQYGGSDALGLNLSTEDIASGFATLSNGGEHRKASYITKVKFADDSEKDIQHDKQRAMKESTAYILLQMMNGVPYENKDAKSAKIKEFKGHAIKTGSVSYDDEMQKSLPDFAAKDGWIGGTTKDVSVVLWTGYDSPNEPGNYLNKNNTKQRQSLYKEIMKKFGKNGNTSNWSKPDTVYSSGSGIKADHSPLDKNAEEFPVPSIDELKSKSFNPFIADVNDKTEVNDSKSGQIKPPKGYKEGQWKDDLSTEDKKVYERWQQDNQYNESDLPDDVYTGD